MSSFVKTFLRQTKARTTSAERKPLSVNKKMEENLRRDDDIILNFLTQSDMPTWFRGLSSFQLDAASSLFNALRDDSEQQTTHRVHACIAAIGLKPTICNKDIKAHMLLCRGNDLAFLWFLWELHYKSTSGSGYNVNEQLILSSITHLDLVTTLRALDRVLPPPQPTKIEIKRQRRKLLQHLTVQTQERKDLTRKLEQKQKSPYFQKLTRPKRYGKPLTISIPDFRVSLGQYEKYKDKNYVVPNESNRWYGTYGLQASRRIINEILNDQLGNIFKNFNDVLPQPQLVKCEHHKRIDELERNLETELRVIAHERCLKHLDLDGKRKDATRKRITEQLNQDVNKYMCKFRKLTENTRRETLCHVLSSECAANRYNPDDCNLIDLSLKEDYPCCTEEDECETEESSENKQISSDSTNVIKQSSGDKLASKASKKADREKPEDSNARTARKHRGMGDCPDDEKSKPSDESKENVSLICDENNKGTQHKGRISQSDATRNVRESFSSRYMTNYDYGHYDPLSPTLSQTFFKAPNEHKPHQFDYRKIFRSRDTTEDPKPNIKQLFVTALESGVPVSKSPSAEDKTMEEERAGREPNYNPAIQNFFQTVWKDGVQIRNEELQREEEAKRLRKNMRTPLDYDLDYYDPEDKQLMHNLLKDALEYIAQDHRYVLASLPDAYKLPTLREWIYVRYGKLYTRDARHNELQMSMKIFRALDKITQDVPMPKVKMLGNQLYVDYSCRDYLIKKANHIKKKYYQRLDANIMEQARVFWFAMRPYLCSNGPPRNTYYAYMPARVVDITRFRLWKSSEFMDAKREWDRRRIMKNKRL